jgi:hypothetical protein
MPYFTRCGLQVLGSKFPDAPPKMAQVCYQGFSRSADCANHLLVGHKYDTSQQWQTGARGGHV